MKGIQKLTWQQLESAYPPSNFLFKTTDDLELLDEIIGQERAKKAMELGLCVKAQGYNIYMSGEPGTGKTTLAKIYAQKAARQTHRASDWCYVYNFKGKRVPKALCFDPGDGRRFKDDINELIAYLTNEIPHIYCTKEYEEKKRSIVKDYQKEKELYIDELKKHAKALEFLFKISEGGISFAPLDEEGTPLADQMYDELEEIQQKKIESGSKILQEMAIEVIREIKVIEQDGVRQLEDLEYQIGLENIGYYIKRLKEKYAEYEDVIEYLKDLQQDILDHIAIFIGEEDNVKQLVEKYDVNLLVDHSESIGAPVIIAHNPAYNKIIGEIEYDNEHGALSTDYMKIKPGLFHQANGGYLILQAEEVLTNLEAWNAIKHVLKTKQLYIENPQGISVMTVATLKPEPIPTSVKVILIGSLKIYHLLHEVDPEFKKLFKVRADFQGEMQGTDSNIKLVARFIKTFSKEQDLRPFAVGAVKEIIRHATRHVENQKKITTEFSWIGNLMIEANAFSDLEGAKVVEQGHVELAVKEKMYRIGRYEEKLEEQMIENMIMIETTGSTVGQINALTVLDTGEYRFGQPVKITATTYKGARGIINIEKEAKLSGPIHTKGTQVIEGYLGQRYGQNQILSMTCRICFEQNYSKIDGDSASSAELYSILSSLSGIPIKQNFAVTGSINQHGTIQPIGGVTHKVEGFFKICQRRGLTGDQGVIIPEQNIQDLVLSNEVIKAIKSKRFHIYAIPSVKEGLELLTGRPYEEIKQKVEMKLKGFNTIGRQD